MFQSKLELSLGPNQYPFKLPLGTTAPRGIALPQSSSCPVTVLKTHIGNLLKMLIRMAPSAILMLKVWSKNQEICFLTSNSSDSDIGHPGVRR